MHDTAKAWRTPGARGTPAGWQGAGPLLFLLIVLAPLLALTGRAWGEVPAGHADWLWLALPSGRRLQLLLQSLGLAAAVALAGTTLGLLAALALWRWRTGWKARARWWLLLLAPLPPYVHALAWSSAVAAFNPWLARHGCEPVSLHGWFGAGCVQMVALLPVAVGLGLVGLESVDRGLIEAARLATGDSRVIARVVLPLAAPLIATGAGFVFLLSLIDYTVPSLFSVNVYALEIFTEFSASHEPVRAFLLSLPILALSLAALACAPRAWRRVAQTPGRPRPEWTAAPQGSVWSLGFQRAALGVLLLQVSLPLVVLAAATGRWGALITAVAAAQRELAFSFAVCLSAALACLPLAWAPLSWFLRPEGRAGPWLWWLIVLPLAIPAPLVGIGLIALWNHPGCLHVYGTPVMPVLAALARFSSLAVIVLCAQFHQIDPLLFDAARVLHRSRWRTWLRIHLPLMAPGLLAAACLVFTLSMGELGATLIVAPPGRATITMRIYNYLHYGASASVAGLCLAMTLLTLAAGGLAWAALARWHRAGRPHG